MNKINKNGNLNSTRLESKTIKSESDNENKLKNKDRTAALGIATLWTKLIANNKLRASKPEESNFFSQFFSRDLLAELKAFPNFEQLDSLLNMEKISNDFK